MPVITSLLEALRLRAHVFHNAQYCGAWGVDISGSSEASFHFVIEGECRFRLRNSMSHSVALSSGDLVVLPNDAAHIIGQGKVSSAKVNDSASVPYAEGLREGAVSLMCGRFQFDKMGPNAVLATLPEFVLLRTEQPPHQGLLSPVTSALRHESRRGAHGSSVIVNRLAEVLFVHMLRMQLSDDASGFGLAAALADPRVARAMELIHSDPQTKLTVADLASEAGMSRSAFTEQFKKLLEVSPMEYCTQWRIQQAYRALFDGAAEIEEVAFDAGYETTASFSRAFKRVIGKTPGEVRRGTVKAKKETN